MGNAVIRMEHNNVILLQKLRPSIINGNAFLQPHLSIVLVAKCNSNCGIQILTKFSPMKPFYEASSKNYFIQICVHVVLRFCVYIINCSGLVVPS